MTLFRILGFLFFPEHKFLILYQHGKGKQEVEI